MNKHVLLLGNGINDVTNKYKWVDLIIDLMNYLDIKNIHIDEKKPFPHLYEEIYLNNLKKSGVKESELKKFIAQNVKNLLPSELHQMIISLGFSDILTTNYDEVIENSFSTKIPSNMGIVKESLYSVFRHTIINNCKIWHLHGDINLPNSILLGYEQYSGQLQHIRNYVVSGTGNEYKNYKLPALMTQLKTGKVENSSWLDLFFTKDIHIIGLTLDFVETDLWWLLTYRARKKLKGKVKINNSITYYFPGKYTGSIQSKLEMLVADEVIVKPVGSKHDFDYYEKVFAEVASVMS